MSAGRETGPRSWRNRNPGNVRPVALPDRWQGQVAVDTAPGGPFSVFGDDAAGWRAVCKVLLRYQGAYKLGSVRAMLYRYAPPAENLTDAYVASVCAKLGVAPDDAVDVRNWPVMRAMLAAIAGVEGGSTCPPWPESGVIEGMTRAGLRP